MGANLSGRQTEGFQIERRGRSSTGRSRKLPKEVEEDLFAEVQRLSAENEFLAKQHIFLISGQLQRGLRPVPRHQLFRQIGQQSIPVPKRQDAFFLQLGSQLAHQSRHIKQFFPLQTVFVHNFTTQCLFFDIFTPRFVRDATPCPKPPTELQRCPLCTVPFENRELSKSGFEPKGKSLFLRGVLREYFDLP